MAVLTYNAIGTRAQGQLPNAKGTLDTVAAGTCVRNYVVELTNTNTADEAVVIYKKISGGSSKIVWAGTLVANNGRVTVFLNSLAPADVLEGVTTTAAKVDYTISGDTYTIT